MENQSGIKTNVTTQEEFDRELGAEYESYGPHLEKVCFMHRLSFFIFADKCICISALSSQ